MKTRIHTSIRHCVALKKQLQSTRKQKHCKGLYYTNKYDKKEELQSKEDGKANVAIVFAVSTELDNQRKCVHFFQHTHGHTTQHHHHNHRAPEKQHAEDQANPVGHLHIGPRGLEEIFLFPELRVAGFGPASPPAPAPLAYATWLLRGTAGE